MRKHFLFFLTAFIFSVFVSFSYSVEEVPNIHKADRTRYLTNPDGIISPEVQTKVDVLLGDIWDKTSSEVVAVVIDSISADIDPDSFATALFEHWGIGKSDKDNGLLFLVSIKDRAAVIRTGYGIEGVVPDIVAGKILRKEVFPRFQQGDYDGGVFYGVKALHDVIVTPEAASELMSKYRNDANAGSESEDAWHGYLIIGVITAIALLIIFLYNTIRFRSTIGVEWVKLSKLKLTYIILTLIFIGIPVIPLGLLLWRLHYLRHKRPDCPRCSADMVKLNDPADRKWLNPMQLTERQLKSVDHDVWECTKCGYGLVNSFPNPQSPYTVCKQCGTKAVSTGQRILRNPTYFAPGVGETISHCNYCGDETKSTFNIAKKIPPVIIPGGRGGGGGFGGGSFGGGHTGGGGASGRW